MHVHLERAATDCGRVDVFGSDTQMLAEFRAPAGREHAVDPGDRDAGLRADIPDRLDMELQCGDRRFEKADLISLGGADDRSGLE